MWDNKIMLLPRRAALVRWPRTAAKVGLCVTLCVYWGEPLAQMGREWHWCSEMQLVEALGLGIAERVNNRGLRKMNYNWNTE